MWYLTAENLKDLIRLWPLVVGQKCCLHLARVLVSEKTADRFRSLRMKILRILSWAFLVGMLASAASAQFQKLEVIASLSRPPQVRPVTMEAIAKRAARQTAGTSADIDTYLSRAVVNIQKGDYAGARENYDRLIDLIPEDAQLFDSRADVDVKLGDANAAAKDRETAGRLFELNVQKNVYDPLAYVARGLYFGRAGNPDRELSDYERAIELGLDTPQIHYFRAVIYLRSNRYENALNDLNRAIELDPKLAEPYKTRAQLFQALGDSARQQADLELAAKLSR
jgi:tetratricopeptide (TPR) repeat protein